MNDILADIEKWFDVQDADEARELLERAGEEIKRVRAERYLLRASLQRIVEETERSDWVTADIVEMGAREHLRSLEEMARAALGPVELAAMAGK
jgi:hypothetical protein